MHPVIPQLDANTYTATIRAVGLQPDLEPHVFTYTAAISACKVIRHPYNASEPPEQMLRIAIIMLCSYSACGRRRSQAHQ